MKIRPFILNRDFDKIKNWITDERTHAMWCANRFEYPLNKVNFTAIMTEIWKEYGDIPHVAVDDSDEIIGFFCYSLNPDTNEGMLKFIMVDPAQRGKGIGKTMIRLALEYAFDITKADAVHLNVFTENARAKKCYESVGFAERYTDADVFAYKDELWGRCNMIIKKELFEI